MGKKLNRATGVQNIGHRGCRGHAPENTLAGFDLALAMGVDMVELDVHLSKDAQLMVIHDSMVDRTTDGTGFVHEMTQAELQTLDAGGWFGPDFAGQRLSTLDDVLRLVAGRVAINVEIKEGGLGAGTFAYDELPHLLADCLRHHEAVENTVISAFHEPYLAAMKAALPEARLALLHLTPVAHLFEQAKEQGWEAVHTHFSLIDRQFVDAARSAGVGVRAWTVNDPGMMAQLVSLGVDGIVTDTPDVLQAVLIPNR